MGNLRYVFEAKLGLSAARNRGLFEARGDFVAFLDDDAVADPDWLEWLARVGKAEGEALGFLGGRVRAIWEAPRPDWLCDDLLPFLSLTNLGDDVIEVRGDSPLVGTNMAFRAQVLRDAGGFPESLGRKGTKLLSYEEVQLRRKLEKMGFRSVYHPKPAVSHHVTSARLTKRWFRSRLFWQGRSEAVSWRIDAQPSLSAAFLLGGRVIASIGKSLVLLAACLATGRDQNCSLDLELRIRKLLGFLIGLLQSLGNSETK
jgi:glycosyltransferase involved in cell wall biosynthesis